MFALIYYTTKIVPLASSSGVYYLERYSDMGCNTTNGVNQLIRSSPLGYHFTYSVPAMQIFLKCGLI